MRPSASVVCSTRPPGRLRASTTSTSVPPFIRSRAALRPARPAPTTTTSDFTGGSSHERPRAQRPDHPRLRRAGEGHRRDRVRSSARSAGACSGWSGRARCWCARCTRASPAASTAGSARARGRWDGARVGAAARREGLPLSSTPVRQRRDRRHSRPSRRRARGGGQPARAADGGARGRRARRARARGHRRGLPGRDAAHRRLRPRADDDRVLVGARRPRALRRPPRARASAARRSTSATTAAATSRRTAAR